jgi:biopolymer transport protein ExbB/TolQ
MQIGALLSSFIYLIAQSLLYPVLILLSLLTLWTLFRGGSVFSEWIERARLKPSTLKDLVRMAETGDAEHRQSRYVADFVGRLGFIKEQPGELRQSLLELTLEENADKLWKTLDGIKMMIRIGPGLGLMGTLIPMGTGLAALAQGDVTRLSSDLVIAFTTTVVGLAQGLCAYLFFTLRKRWIQKDIGTMEFLASVTTAEWNRTHGLPETKPPTS